MKIIHSDIRGFDFTSKSSLLSGSASKKQVIDFAFEELDHLSGGQAIYLPAFNYNFTSSRIFDPEKDLPQVGSIPMAAMNKNKWVRSKTPVYSFLAKGQEPKTYTKPFSSDSTFGEIVSKNGEILLLGVNFDRMTFIHHVEDLAKSPYRYNKKFEGKILNAGGLSSVSVEFHVRPKGLPIEYDFSRVERLLFSNSAAKRISNKIIVVYASRAFECMIDKLAEDPFYFLLPETAKKVVKKLEFLGRGFLLEDFE